MNENEKTMEIEINPYDHLIKQEEVKPAILLKKHKTTEQHKKETSPETKSLAENAVWSEIETGEIKVLKTVTANIEEDLLVPDSEPDMDAIFDLDAYTGELSIEEGKISGKVHMEMMYLPDKAHNSKVIIIKADVPFSEEAGITERAEALAEIKGIRYRIINERKYRITLSVEIKLIKEEKTKRKVFAGFDDNEVEYKKEVTEIAELVLRTSKELDFSENIPLKQEGIHPVKILKASFTPCENHRQITSGKVILNGSIWVRIIYLAEITTQGNIANNLMYYSGKLDFTQFIPSEGKENITAAKTCTDARGLSASVNNASNGFRIEGTIKTDAMLYSTKQLELITDFFHKKEDMSFEKYTSQLCTGLEASGYTQEFHEIIAGGSETSVPEKILYIAGNVTDLRNNICNVQLNVLALDGKGRAMIIKKNTEFQLPGNSIENVRIKEITAQVTSTGSIDVNIIIQVETCDTQNKEICFIENPCRIESQVKQKTYPLIICTVKDGESLWDIAKKYKVPVKHIKKINGIDTIKEGMRLTIVK